jgi:hypothetical protein
MISLKNIVLLTMLLVLMFACRKSGYETPSGPEIIRDNGGGTGTVTWTSEQDYLVEGLVFVNDGQELTIEAGTVVRFKAGQGSAASALIVARGGKIFAEGSESKPIIFTTEDDDLEGSVPVDATGLWGGLIILGNARLNLSAGESHVEGIPVYEPRGVFGGYNDEDDSGVLRYLSIRHGGTNIGEGNEINGLTLAAVGNRTIVEHIEVISNTDDGVEAFGGTVNMRYISIAFCGDDAFDFDLGYRGKVQFVLGIQYFNRGDKLLEIDGGTDPVTGTPYSQPIMFNATLIGRGPADVERLAAFGRNAAGTVANSLLIEQRFGVEIEYVPGAESCYQQFTDGRLKLESNMFFQTSGNDPENVLRIRAAAGVPTDDQQNTLSSYFTQAGNKLEDPGIQVENGYFNIFPKGNIFDGLVSPPDEWFSATTFKGAFYTYSWVEGWTLLNQEGFVP